MQKEFEDLKNWAQTRNILFIEAEVKSKSTTVEIPNIDHESIDVFKQVAEKLDVKVVIYELLDFDSDTFGIFQATIENIEDEEIKEDFEVLKNFENQLLGYTLYFFDNGIEYQIGNYLDEAEKFMRVQSSINRYFRDETSKFKTLSEEKVTEFGEELANHENYSKLKSRAQRQSLARQLFSQKLTELKVHDFYISSIVLEAESYYEIEIKPKVEAKLKEQITELLERGVTKVKIASELGISKDTVNKYI